MAINTFENHLEKVYEGLEDYQGLRVLERITLLAEYFLKEKDFRYFIPMFFLKDFDINIFQAYERKHFGKTLEEQLEVVRFVKFLYAVTTNLVLRIRVSCDSIVKDSVKHRAKKPKTDLAAFKDITTIADTQTNEFYEGYKLKTIFFYEYLPKFNSHGPLYRNLREKVNSGIQINKWSSLPLKDKTICDYKSLIEYYIYTNNFPVEWDKLFLSNGRRNSLYVKPTPGGLRAALAAQDFKLLGCNMGAFELIPKTVKQEWRAFIRRHAYEIRKHTRREDQCYLNAWKCGMVGYTKETEA